MDCVRIGISMTEGTLRDEGIDPERVDVFELTKLMMLLHLKEPEQVSCVIRIILTCNDMANAYIAMGE